MKPQLKLLEDLAAAHRLAMNGLDRWHRCGVGTASQKKAWDQMERNEDKFNRLLEELKGLMSETK